MTDLPECVWLTRHAETLAPHVFNGAESDIALSDLGRRQTALAAEWFARRGVTAVVSSNMLRARETAAPIAAACGVPHHIEPDLHERRVGGLGGTPFSLIEGPWARTVAAWMAGDTRFSTPGAESFEELTARLLPAWRRVVAAHPAGRVAVVAHGVVCKVLLLSLLEDWGVEGWTKLGRVANLSVSRLQPAEAGRWRAPELLQIPPGVAALSNGAPTGVGADPVGADLRKSS